MGFLMSLMGYYNAYWTYKYNEYRKAQRRKLPVPCKYPLYAVKENKIYTLIEPGQKGKWCADCNFENDCPYD